jgi:hypothetical protein
VRARIVTTKAVEDGASDYIWAGLDELEQTSRATSIGVRNRGRRDRSREHRLRPRCLRRLRGAGGCRAVGKQRHGPGRDAGRPHDRSAPRFVDVKGEGASALLGTPDAALIPEGGAVMFQQCFQFKSAPKSKPFRVHRTPSESGRGRGELRSSERS